jgi:hypothetical protein
LRFKAGPEKTMRPCLYKTKQKAKGLRHGSSGKHEVLSSIFSTANNNSNRY